MASRSALLVSAAACSHAGLSGDPVLPELREHCGNHPGGHHLLGDAAAHFRSDVLLPLVLCDAGRPSDEDAQKILPACIDNPFFTLFLAVYQVINTLLSLLLAFLAPGFTGISLACSVATKLLLFKYDYLEENPEANRKAIPWDDLLYEEREAVGPRSLKGMIFPWKD